jgi:tetratricopeptide (TPR) repeat protein
VSLERHDDAIRAADKAIEFIPRNFEAYLTRMQAQAEKGEYVEARKTMQNMAKILPPDAGKDGFQQMGALFDGFEKARQQLPAVLAGDKKPATANENLLCGILCSSQHRDRHALAAVRLFKAAFALEPRLADSTFHWPRLAAAECAVRAAAGNSDDALPLAVQQRAELRREALNWLKADLKVLKANISDNPNHRVSLHSMIRMWRQHPDLAAVREPAELAMLPTAERVRWNEFWDDVTALQRKLAE